MSSIGVAQWALQEVRFGLEHAMRSNGPQYIYKLIFLHFHSQQIEIREYKIYIDKLNHHSSSEYPPKSSEEGAGGTASGVDNWLASSLATSSASSSLSEAWGGGCWIGSTFPFRARVCREGLVGVGGLSVSVFVGVVSFGTGFLKIYPWTVNSFSEADGLTEEL